MKNGAVGLLSVVLTAGCVGQIGGGGDRGPSAGDREMQTVNPELFSVAKKYFPGETAGAAPTRVFRLTRSQLDVTTKTLLPAQYLTTALATLPPDPLQTNYEYADNLGFNDANFTPYTNWVDQIVAGVKASPATVINCAAAGNSPTCLQAEARKFVATAFRGTGSDAQLGRYADFFTASVGQVGLPDAAADLVGLALTSPSYVFRDEVLTDGAHLLLPAQRLQNITYTLADAPPETVGLSSLTPDPYLQSPGDVQQTIDRVLATPEARAKLLRFFAAWLEIREPAEFTIAPSVFPEFTPAVAAAVVDETKRFLDHQLTQAAPTLKDVTQSTQSFVSEATAFLYGVQSPSGGGLVDLDPTQRLGIFTQPAVLASHSGPTTTRLVKRGVFFTRKVMCLALGSPPPDVDTTIPGTTGVTERQKIEGLTAAPRCQGCHAYINPFGFMQENYDAIGRWRTTEAGLPIDASISVSFLDEGNLSADQPVTALKGFTSSMLFKQCFVRQLFRFYMGRDESPGDDPLLRKMFFDFANQDQQAIIGLLRDLGNATNFSQRSEAP